MSDKARIILLGCLTAALALLWWYSGRRQEFAQQRSFREHLLQVDTATLHAFTIVPAAVRHLPPLHFERDSIGWAVSTGSARTRAFQRPIDQLLVQLTDLRPNGVAGSTPAIMDRYRLADSLTNMIEVPGPGGGTLRIGSVTSGSGMATAIILKGDPEAYLVPGTLGTLIAMNFVDWIPKPLVNGNPHDWERLTFVFPGRQSYTMERTATGWMVNGQPADSMKVGKYLSAMSRYYGSRLANPADTLHAVLMYSLRVEDRSRLDPIILGIFQTANGYIARSTLAPPWQVIPLDPVQELGRMFRPPEVFLPAAHDEGPAE